MTPDEPFEIVRAGRSPLVLLSCEHASERVPAPFRWPAADAWLRGTHWALDLGAAELTRELAAAWGTTAVLSRFSRLLADPNRPVDHPDLFRRVAEGRAIELNRALGAEEASLRVRALHAPYHAALDREVAASPAEILLAVHTFTPVYEGTPRTVEVGVLFDAEERLAVALRDELERAGLRAALNEPWSGRAGLMYSVERHAAAHGRRALELEVRQDFAMDEAFRARLASILVPALARCR